MNVIGSGTYGNVKYIDSNTVSKKVKILEYISDSELELYSQELSPNTLRKELKNVSESFKYESSEEYIKSQLKINDESYLCNLHLLYPNLKETCFLSQFKSRYIVSLYNVKLDLYNNSLELDLKNVGVDLYTYIRKNGTDYLKYIIFQILQILEAFSRNDLIHGDLTSRNICVDSKGRICLIDFGSICFNSKHKNDTYCTPIYDAPEASKMIFFPINDVYSLGVCILTLFDKNILKYGYLYISKSLQLIYNFEIRKIVSAMLESDYKKRPTALELLNSKYFSEFIFKPLNIKIKNVKTAYDINDVYLYNSKKDFSSIRTKLLKYIYNLLQILNLQHYSMHTTYLIDTYVYYNICNYSDLVLIGISCACITNIIFSFQRIETALCYYGKIKYLDLLLYIFKILKFFEFTVYIKFPDLEYMYCKNCFDLKSCINCIKYEKLTNLLISESGFGVFNYMYLNIAKL
jgi:serine/threonine protein kinase